MKVKYLMIDSYFIMNIFLAVFQYDVMQFHMKKKLSIFTSTKPYANYEEIFRNIY